MSEATTKPLWQVMIGLTFGVVLCVIFVGAFSVIIAACLSKSAHAADGTLCTKMHGLQVQKKAPCTGVLGPEKVVRDGAKCIAPNGQLATCETKLATEKAGRDADTLMNKTVLRSEQKRADTCCTLALEPKKPVPDPPWYETVEWKVSLSVVVTGVLVGLFVAVLYETQVIEQ